MQCAGLPWAWGGKHTVSLIVVLTNDGTGTNESANYRFEVWVNTRPIARGEIRGHDRRKGWAALLAQLAEFAHETDEGDLDIPALYEEAKR